MHRCTGIRILGTGLALAVALSVTGPVAPAAATELLLYSSRHYPKEPAFEAFTKKTGITLKVFHASDAELFERLKAEGDRTPADLLVTVDAGNLWNAARAGYLAPVDSPELDRNIPANLRDPQDRWVALAVRARTIMYNTTRVKPEELSTYAALGDPKWKGRLCLRNSTHIYNQSLLATMIKRYGEPRTEEIVRGWVANQPTLINGDAKILEAIAAGQCDVGVTNTYYLGRALAKDPSLPGASLLGRPGRDRRAREHLRRRRDRPQQAPGGGYQVPRVPLDAGSAGGMGRGELRVSCQSAGGAGPAPGPSGAPSRWTTSTWAPPVSSRLRR